MNNKFLMTMTVSIMLNSAVSYAAPHTQEGGHGQDNPLAATRAVPDNGEGATPAMPGNPTAHQHMDKRHHGSDMTHEGAHGKSHAKGHDKNKARGKAKGHSKD